MYFIVFSSQNAKILILAAWCVLVLIQNKKETDIGLYPKGQFCKNTVYLKRGIPYFCICGHKCSAYQENWQVIGEHKEKAPLCKEPFSNLHTNTFRQIEFYRSFFL